MFFHGYGFYVFGFFEEFLQLTEMFVIFQNVLPSIL